MTGRKLVFIFSILAFAGGVGCTKKSTTDASSSSSVSMSLGSLPSVTTAVKSTSTSGVVSSLAVSGTPPTLATLGEYSSNDLTSAAKTAVKAAFWTDSDGSALLDDIIANYTNNVPSAKRAKFFGSTAGGPGGKGACMMAQGVAEGVSRMVESMSSTCYMKGIASKSFGNGITQISGSTALANIWDKGASSRVVKVNVKAGATLQQTVYVTVGAPAGNDYSVTLHFCDTTPTVVGYESYSFASATNLLTVAGQRQEGSNLGSFGLTAGINPVDLSFDSSVDRVATTLYSGSWGKFKGRVEVSGSTIKGYRWWTDGTTSSKDYSYASITGSSLPTLRFLEGGFKSLLTGSFGSFDLSGGTEYSTNRYASVTSSAYITDAATYGPGGSNPHSFFTGTGTALAAPTIDFTGYSCSVTPNDEIDFNISATDGAAIDTTCSGERFQGYSMCYIGDVSNAENKVFSSWNAP